MAKRPVKILVVDDDPALLAVLEVGLRLHEDYAVTATVSAREAAGLIARETFDLVITDYSLGDEQINGLEILRLTRQHCEQTLVIIITAFASLEITLESIHLGAYDFLTKPFQLDELQLVARNAATRIHLERENEHLHAQIADMIGSLNEIELQHAELLEQIRGLDEESAAPEPAPRAMLVPIDLASLHEMRRRRMREQLSTYVRMGETIRERLTRERQRIEGLFERGLLPESAYQRALRARPKEIQGA